MANDVGSQQQVNEAQKRKMRPIYSGVLKYFPDALLEVALTSFLGNEQHNPGQPLHWAKEKSSDEGDALVRHLLDAGTRDTDGVRHSAKVAWRALALLQREIEAERATAQAEVIDMRGSSGVQGSPAPRPDPVAVAGGLCCGDYETCLLKRCVPRDEHIARRRESLRLLTELENTFKERA